MKMDHLPVSFCGSEQRIRPRVAEKHEPTQPGKLNLKLKIFLFSLSILASI